MSTESNRRNPGPPPDHVSTPVDTTSSHHASVALALVWWPGPYAVERLYFVALMGAVVYAAFFVALATMPIYGGAAYDDNGYLPFKAPLPLIAEKWDLNVTVFSGLVVILAAGTVVVGL